MNSWIHTIEIDDLGEFSEVTVTLEQSDTGHIAVRTFISYSDEELSEEVMAWARDVINTVATLDDRLQLGD